MVLLIGSSLFHFPETVQVEMTLSPRNPPAYIKCTAGGKLESVYVVNGQQVKKGDMLAVMENVASTGDILLLRMRFADLRLVLGSEFVPVHHPFKAYFYGLPKWEEGDTDYIGSLADTVTLADGSPETKHTFRKLFKVGTVNNIPVNTKLSFRRP